MSPIEHYFENLLVRGSDIKGEPNKNALSKEVQEAIEICAYYIKDIQLYKNAIPNDSNSEKVATLTELQTEIEKLPMYYDPLDISDLIQQKINKLKEKNNDN